MNNSRKSTRLLGGMKDFPCTYFDITDSDVLRLRDEIGACGIDPRI